MTNTLLDHNRTIHDQADRTCTNFEFELWLTGNNTLMSAYDYDPPFDCECVGIFEPNCPQQAHLNDQLS